VGELVYGRITKLVPFGAFVQVGDGIEGLVHISEMAAHHVDLPEQVVTPGEELWVKIIDIDLQRRRISLSIKQAAEGGIVAEEYQEAFGEHAYDEQGNYIGSYDYTTEFTPESESQAAWAEFTAAAAATAQAEAAAAAAGAGGAETAELSAPPTDEAVVAPTYEAVAVASEGDVSPAPADAAEPVTAAAEEPVAAAAEESAPLQPSEAAEATE